MYHYLDKPLNNASPSEKFLIWAVRGWRAAVYAKKCPRHFLRSGFNGRGGQGLYPKFNAFMHILHASPAREIKICSLSCPRIAEDEALILTALSGLEHNNTAPAQVIFRDLVNSENTDKALTIASQLMGELSKAKFSFQPENVCAKRPH